MAQDALQIKEKIITTLRRRGPSLPVHVAKETGLSILFASAFLSELAYDKRVKISSMKVGGSPLYLLPDHIHMLERFYEHLKSKEKDAFLLLREKKFLKDSEQEPAIRIALRNIKDFAIPFERNNEVYWRYFIAPETEFKEEVSEYKITKMETPEQLETEVQEEPLLIEEKPIEIDETIEKQLEISETKKEKIKKEARKQKPQKRVKKKTGDGDRFFNRIKDFLSGKGIDIMDIEDIKKNELVFRVKENKQEKLIFALNKKRVSETDILRAYKKASEVNLPYLILSLGESPKKLSSIIEASKSLSSIEKIE